MLITETRAEVRVAALDKILAKHPGDEVARKIPLTTAALKKGPLFVLDGMLEDESLSLVFDGLKRVDGASKLGDFITSQCCSMKSGKSTRNSGCC